MKVIAQGSLSGAVGDREKGEEFVVDAKSAARLLARGLVKEVAVSVPPLEKATKPKE